jgi:hypothetical protein
VGCTQDMAQNLQVVSQLKSIKCFYDNAKF